MASADFTRHPDGWKASASRKYHQAGRGITNDDYVADRNLGVDEPDTVN